MKQINKNVLKVIERATRVEVVRQFPNWPFCCGIFHQPVRPVKPEKKF